MPKKPTKPPKPKQEARPAGRPTAYTDEIAEVICARIGNGESLKRICSDDGMPSMQTVYNWIRIIDGFLEKYTRAREDQAEGYADEITEIADLSEDPAKAKVQIDARKWVAAKLKPKKFGDFQRKEVSGPDGGPIDVKASLPDAVTDILSKLGK